MNICSMNNMYVIQTQILMSYPSFRNEKWLLARGYQWKQLVLPGFELIMGV